MLVPRGFVKGKSVEAIWDLDDSHHLLLHSQFVPARLPLSRRARKANFHKQNVQDHRLIEDIDFFQNKSDYTVN